MKTSDLKFDENTISRFLFVGPSGSGKTTSAASFPKPLFIFDFDRNLNCLAGVEGVEYETFHDVETFKKKVDDIAKKPDQYKTYLFDSCTKLSVLLLRYFAKINNHADADGSPNKHIGMLEYGQRIGWYTEFFSRLADWPSNVIVIAHEETTKDDVQGYIKTRAALPGVQLPDIAPGFFTEVYRFESLVGGNPPQKETRVHTIASPLFAAKTSFRGKLPPFYSLKLQPNGFAEGLWDKIVLSLKGGKA